MFVLVQASSIWSIGGGEFPICGFFHLEMKLFFFGDWTFGIKLFDVLALWFNHYRGGEL